MCINVQWRIFWPVILAPFICTINSSALKTHEFFLGQNATVNFPAELSSSSELCEMFSLENEKPFYTHNKIDPTALKPRQVGRFSVNIVRLGSNFTAQLNIVNIDKIDSGVYVLAIEEMNAQRTRHISDAYVNVIQPPGKAKCRAEYSPYSPKLREVHCQATLSSEGGGLILCYQNEKKAPFITPVSHTESLITGVFWLNLHQPGREFRCCSFEANHEKDSESCNDFQYQFHSETIMSTSRTPNSSSHRGLEQNVFPLHDLEISSTLKPTYSTSNVFVASENSDWSLNTLGVTLLVMCSIFFMSTVILTICQCSKKSERSVEEGNGDKEIKLTDTPLLNKEVVARKENVYS